MTGTVPSSTSYESGHVILKIISVQLAKLLRRNATIDWTARVTVKRILRHHGYPPDKQEQATQTVLEQAEVLAGAWAGG